MRREDCRTFLFRPFPFQFAQQLPYPVLFNVVPDTHGAFGAFFVFQPVFSEYLGIGLACGCQRCR
jgi:hypothetical protein